MLFLAYLILGLTSKAETTVQIEGAQIFDFYVENAPADLQ